MTSWMKNQLTKIYNAVSAPAAAIRDVPTERLESLRESASLLYNRMVENMRYWPETLKDIIEKEAEEEQQQEEEYEDCCEDPWALRFMPDQFKTQEMCIKALEVSVWQLKDISDYFKMQDMCDDVVRRSHFIFGIYP